MSHSARPNPANRPVRVIEVITVLVVLGILGAILLPRLGAHPAKPSKKPASSHPAKP